MVKMELKGKSFMFTRVIEVIIQLMKDLSEYQYNQNDINSVAENLSTLGYTNEEITAALVWLLKRLDNQTEISDKVYQYIPPKKTKTFRILHDIEQMIITPEAYGYIIQLRELGLLDDEQTERIIERAMGLNGQRITAEEMKLVIASVLFDPEYIGWQNHSLLMSSLMQEQETIH